MSRSFYVGKHVTEEDIHPKYENGILSLQRSKRGSKTGRREETLYQH